MTETVTSSEMRGIERRAIQSGSVTGLELMERAGEGVVAAILTEWPNLADGNHSAVVLCGPGNNGGDGFVVARLLKERGWAVELFLHGNGLRLPPDAKANYERWSELAAVRPLDGSGLQQAAVAAKARGHKDLVVIDALFGIGQRAPLDEVLRPVQDMVDAIFDESAGPAPIFVNIDIPTGYDADTGERLAATPCPSDLIVTFHRPKPIHEMPHMLDTRLQVADIGL